MNLKAIEYRCDGVVSIRLCPEGSFAWGVAPEYWYIKRPLWTMDAPEIGMTKESIRELKANGYEVAYWDGEKWFHHSPKNFCTAEEAWLEWSEKVQTR